MSDRVMKKRPPKDPAEKMFFWLTLAQEKDEFFKTVDEMCEWLWDGPKNKKDRDRFDDGDIAMALKGCIDHATGAYDY